ncbi:MAG: class I SAM-dependent methyltransferase [Gammaproteobacteria bacterium]|nr:class I SAM-dependent methyltransferase [Gammaproteobacteria bacterium]
MHTGDIYFKQRRRQREGRQYEKLGGSGEQHAVTEGSNRFLVNFTDYLDTGLFLDHRPIRQYIGKHAEGCRFLNLFAYTGTATVAAARGGARSSVSVDLSRTYIDWAKRNMDLNGLGGNRHEFIQEDARKWLKKNGERAFDLIFLDPPSFSRSKRMQGTLDTQRDHVALDQAGDGNAGTAGRAAVLDQPAPFQAGLRTIKSVRNRGYYATDHSRGFRPQSEDTPVLQGATFHNRRCMIPDCRHPCASG